MSKVSSNHTQQPEKSPAASSVRPNKVSRPGWLEIVVGLVVCAIIGFVGVSQFKRLGLARCRCSRRFQPAHNPSDGSRWHGLIGRIGV